MRNFTRSMHKRISDLKCKLFTIMWYQFFFIKAGAGCLIHPPFFTHRPEYIQLGARVSIGPYCRIEVHPIQPGPRLLTPVLKIGNRVQIGQGTTISCHNSLHIEDDVYIGAGCSISDNYHLIDPEAPRNKEKPLTASPILIGRGVSLGQKVCVLPGARIGECSVIGAGSLVEGEIPPYSIATGTPAQVVKQYNFNTKQWEKVYWVKTVSKMATGI